MSDLIRILSIDGGGIRGIIPAMLLQALLGGRDAKEVFHLISGTSTGGIIACGLARPQPLPLQNIVDLYVKHGGEIFQKGLWQKLPGADLLRPKYAPTVLESYLASEFGTTMLSEVQDVELLVPSYAIGLPKTLPNGDTRAPLFFRSWQARGHFLEAGATKDEYDFSLESVTRATSAAPTYFSPANIKNKAGQPFCMIDGGMFANNPTLCAMVEAYHLYHSKDFLVVSLGTGYQQKPIPLDRAAKWGEAGWLLSVLSILMDGNADTVDFETRELLGSSLYYRFDIALGPMPPANKSADEEMDDASTANIVALQDKANQMIYACREDIQKLTGLLSGPKRPVSPAGHLPPKGFLTAPVS
jgi:uncharacterized protein